MAAIDLTTTASVRGYLSITAGASAGAPPVIATTIAAPISAGIHTVTPLSMQNIAVNTVLQIDVGMSQEYVQVTGITGTTFTASFALPHAATPVPVADVTDSVIAGMISDASQIFLERIGVASLNSVNTFNETYDGNGTSTLFLRQRPIVSITQLMVNTVIVPQSTQVNIPGWVVADDAARLIIRPAGLPWGQGWNGGVGIYRQGYAGWGWAYQQGLQNIQVSYTAGYTMTPWDIQQKVTQLVAINYKRRDWIDQQSQVLQGAGNIRYRDWEFPPEVENCIRRYMRRSLN